MTHKRGGDKACLTPWEATRVLIETLDRGPPTGWGPIHYAVMREVIDHLPRSCPGVPGIARRLGRSRATVYAALSQIEAWGGITRDWLPDPAHAIRRRRSAETMTGNLPPNYRITVESIRAMPHGPPRRCPAGKTPGVQRAGQEDPMGGIATLPSHRISSRPPRGSLRSPLGGEDPLT